MQTVRKSGPWGGLVACTIMMVLHALAAAAGAELQLPAIPADRNFIQDYAQILSIDAESRIGRFQREAFEQHDTPIMVVTIGTMAEYGGQGYSIERFAYEWFNHWQIGKRGQSDELINRGILLLISVGDRKARIELGADWGHRWDGYAAEVMGDAIVPGFKQGNYDGGAVAGVAALAEMARLGPEATPPQGDLLDSLNERPLPTTPLPIWGIGLMVLAGAGLIALSFFLPQYRKWLLIVGIGLVVGAFVVWVLLVVFAFFSKGRSGGGGGFSSGGGFGGGGFSGGGGASGSW